MDSKNDELKEHIVVSRMNHFLEKIENENIVPKISTDAHPVLTYANSYYFPHGEYFFDNNTFYRRLPDGGFEKLKKYGCPYPHSFLYPIGGKKAVAVHVATFKLQYGID